MQSIKYVPVLSVLTVVGKRRNKGIGLEIPAMYIFHYEKPSKLNKLRELLKDKEDKDDTE